MRQDEDLHRAAVHHSCAPRWMKSNWRLSTLHADLVQAIEELLVRHACLRWMVIAMTDVCPLHGVSPCLVSSPFMFSFPLHIPLPALCQFSTPLWDFLDAAERSQSPELAGIVGPQLPSRVTRFLFLFHTRRHCVTAERVGMDDAKSFHRREGRSLQEQGCCHTTAL